MTMRVIDPVDNVSGSPSWTRASAVATAWGANGALYTSPVDTPRFNWDRETGQFMGLLYEPGRQNLLLNSAVLSTQTRSVSPGTTYTLSFYGSGQIVLTGANGATLQTAAGVPNRRVTYTFTASASMLTLTVSGSIEYAQLEVGSSATSYIPTTSATATRESDIVSGTGIFASTFTDTRPTWNSGTTYALGAVVQHAGMVYESLIAGNVGNTPNVVPASPPYPWLEIGPVNQLAMFDRTYDIRSVGGNGYQMFAFRAPALVDGVALVNCQAEAVEVAVFNMATRSLSLAKRAVVGGSVFIHGLTPGDLVSVLVTHSTKNVEIGEFGCGPMHYLGECEYGLSGGIKDYSTRTTDAQRGFSKFVQGPFEKSLAASLVLKPEAFNGVAEFLFSMRGRPAFWSATDDQRYAAMAVVYAAFEDFGLEIPYPTQSRCFLKLQGLA